MTSCGQRGQMCCGRKTLMFWVNSLVEVLLMEYRADEPPNSVPGTLKPPKSCSTHFVLPRASVAAAAPAAAAGPPDRFLPAASCEQDSKTTTGKLL